MPALLERLGVDLPVIQAGLGGGVADHRLAVAVSEAGGLGTLGILPPAELREEIARARRLSPAAIAANLLLPFARREHWRAASEADVVVSFWGRPRRRTERPWLHQCGSVAEALAARSAGADGVIAQGVEAGGHVRGTLPALELLERVRAALPPDYPVLLAGGIARADDVAEALAAGAEAAVLGTRFLASEECGAHPEYKLRVTKASETVLTELFGVGWPAAPHRVLRNGATERWLRSNVRGPQLIRILNRASGPVARRLPARVQGAAFTRQRPEVPFYSPQPPLEGHPAELLEAAPLYAGESVSRIFEVRPAAALVRELAGQGHSTSAADGLPP
jgi:nitronate monooxygenase